MIKPHIMIIIKKIKFMTWATNKAKINRNSINKIFKMIVAIVRKGIQN